VTNGPLTRRIRKDYKRRVGERLQPAALKNEIADSLSTLSVLERHRLKSRVRAIFDPSKRLELKRNRSSRTID